MHTLLDSTATNAHRKVRSPAHVQAFSRLSGRQQSTSPQRKIRPIKDHRHPYNTTQLVILVKDLQQETAELCSNLARLQVAEHAYGKDPARLTKALDKAYDAVRDAQKVCHTCLDRAGLQIIEEKENVKVTPVHTRFVEADVVVKAHPQSPSPVVVKAAIPHTPPPARDVQARKISRIKSPIRVRVETPSKTEVFVISRPPARVLSTPPRGSPSAPQLQPSPEITPPAKDAKKDWYHLSKNQALDAIAKQASKWGQRPAAVKLPLSHGCLMMGANQAGAYPTLTIKGFKTLTLHKVLAVAKYGPKHPDLRKYRKANQKAKGSLHLSHLCHHTSCLTPSHIHIESPKRNIRRQKCARTPHRIFVNLEGSNDLYQHVNIGHCGGCEPPCKGQAFYAGMGRKVVDKAEAASIARYRNMAKVAKYL